MKVSQAGLEDHDGEELDATGDAAAGAAPSAQQPDKPEEWWEKAGCSHPAEILLTAPYAYKDFSIYQKTFSEDDVDQEMILECRVLNWLFQDENRAKITDVRRAKRTVINGVTDDGTGVQITFRFCVAEAAGLKQGQHVWAKGTLRMFENIYYLNSVDLITDKSELGVIPQYKGIRGAVRAGDYRRRVMENRKSAGWAANKILQETGLGKEGFPLVTGFQDPIAFLKALHLPETLVDGALACDAARALSIEWVRKRAEKMHELRLNPKSGIRITAVSLQRRVKAIPFKLTGDQARSIREIVADLKSDYKMNRLLSGDVGTGKSVTFMVPAAAAHDAGARVAVIAPSVLVVQQLHREFSQFYPDIEAHAIVAGSKLPESGVLFGTTALHALARKKEVVFDLLVTDEQQKFGVRQKESLQSGHTNMLEATATAIPRTNGLVYFGGMSVSILKECPVRKRIQTHFVSDADGKRLLEHMKNCFRSGKQAVVVYPAVESENFRSSNKRTPTVLASHERWVKHFPGRVGMIHGKMKDTEKSQIIKDFVDLKYDLLISSVLIEIGVTLPALGLMIVMHPERFGLSQLHQLRGRVARKGGSGRMFLYAGADVTEDQHERLSNLLTCNDGFALADMDMKLRGVGDVIEKGSKQHGRTRTLFFNVALESEDLEALVIKAE